jgi:hypothetical protein
MNGSSEVCSGHAMTNIRAFDENVEGDGFWDGENCGAIDLTDSDFDDDTLDPEDYRVTL